MTGPVFMIGGPNLGRLGTREPQIYGDTTWAELGDLCHRWAADLGFDLEFLQTDNEGELVGLVHRAADTLEGFEMTLGVDHFGLGRGAEKARDIGHAVFFRGLGKGAVLLERLAFTGEGFFQVFGRVRHFFPPETKTNWNQ